MNTLMPRLVGDLFEWFDPEPFVRAGHMIRIEDRLGETEYLVRAELPGCDPQKDIEINVENGMLTIKCEREEQKQEHDRTEFRYGRLQRIIRLPGNAVEPKIAAKYDKGVLEVKVPLAEHKAAGRHVPIAIAPK